MDGGRSGGTAELVPLLSAVATCLVPRVNLRRFGPAALHPPFLVPCFQSFGLVCIRDLPELQSVSIGARHARHAGPHMGTWHRYSDAATRGDGHRLRRHRRGRFRHYLAGWPIGPALSLGGGSALTQTLTQPPSSALPSRQWRTAEHRVCLDHVLGWQSALVTSARGRQSHRPRQTMHPHTVYRRQA